MLGKGECFQNKIIKILSNLKYNFYVLPNWNEMSEKMYSEIYYSVYWIISKGPVLMNNNPNLQCNYICISPY